MNLRWLFLAVLALCMPTTSRAQEAVRSNLDARFASCAMEFENMLGSYYLFDRGGNQRPSVDNVIDSARFGIMLYNPTAPGILRGNVQDLGLGSNVPLLAQIGECLVRHLADVLTRHHQITKSQDHQINRSPDHHVLVGRRQEGRTDVVRPHSFKLQHRAP